MPVLIQVRDVDARVRDELKARAAAQGVSLNTYLRGLLTAAAAQPTRAEVFARIASRSERSTTSSASVIRRDRDARAGAGPA